MDIDMADIFLSYARQDSQTAQILAKILAGQGWSVWWDNSLQAGDKWDEVIENQIKAAHCVIVIWSQVSVNKIWVRVEANEGLRRNILVPVLIDDAIPPLAFRLIHTESLIGLSQAASHPNLQRFLDAAAACLARSQSGSPPSARILEAPAQTRRALRARSIRPYSLKVATWITILTSVASAPWFLPNDTLTRFYERVTTPPEVWGIYYSASELMNKEQYQDARAKIQHGLEIYPGSLPLELIRIELDISSQNLKDVESEVQKIANTPIGVLYTNKLNVMRGRLQERYDIRHAFELVERLKNVGFQVNSTEKLMDNIVTLIDRLEQLRISHLSSDEGGSRDQSKGFVELQRRYLALLTRRSDLDLQAKLINQSRGRIASMVSQSYNELRDTVSNAEFQKNISGLQHFDKELEFRLRNVDTNLANINAEIDTTKKLIGWEVKGEFKLLN